LQRIAVNDERPDFPSRFPDCPRRPALDSIIVTVQRTISNLVAEGDRL